MQAEGIRTGDRYDDRDDRGRIIGGWTATGDAVVAFDPDLDRDQVFVPVRLHDGRESARIYDVGQQVDISFGHGTPETQRPFIPGR